MPSAPSLHRSRNRGVALLTKPADAKTARIASIRAASITAQEDPWQRKEGRRTATPPEPMSWLPSSCRGGWPLMTRKSPSPDHCQDEQRSREIQRRKRHGATRNAPASRLFLFGKLCSDRRFGVAAMDGNAALVVRSAGKRPGRRLASVEKASRRGPAGHPGR